MDSKNQDYSKNITTEPRDSLDVLIKTDNQINEILNIKPDHRKNFHDTLKPNDPNNPGVDGMDNSEENYSDSNKNQSDSDSLSEVFFPSQEDGVRKSCFQRYCGRIEKGSLRGSVFSMVTIALGTGVLSLPRTFSVMGVLPAVICLAFSGFNVIMNLYFLAIVASKYKVFEYSVLVKKLTNSFMSKLYDISCIIYLFGALIAYQVIIYRLICTISFDFFYSGPQSLVEYLDNGPLTANVYRWPISFGIAVVVLYPLALFKNLSEFRVISLLGIFSLFYIILVIIIEFPFYMTKNVKDPSISFNWVNPSSGFTSKLLFFPALTSIFFAYGTPVGALPVYQELTNNVQRRVKKVYRNSIFLLIAIYFLIGVCGYLSVPLTTPSLIIDREKYFTNDLVFSIGKILFLVTLIFAYSTNYICARISIVSLVFENQEDFNNKHNLLITAIFIALSTLIACLYSKASDYMSVLGGFLAVIIANFLPTYMWVKSNEFPKNHWRNVVAVGMTALICVLGWIGGVVTAVNMFS